MRQAPVSMRREVSETDGMRSSPGNPCVKASTRRESLVRPRPGTKPGFVSRARQTPPLAASGVPSLHADRPSPLLSCAPAGTSTCPKIAIALPGLTSSTDTLIDGRLRDDEAWGINGRTPAKRTAANPKPQGRTAASERGGGQWHVLGWQNTSHGEQGKGRVRCRAFQGVTCEPSPALLLAMAMFLSQSPCPVAGTQD